jgi:hypothetical protein
VIRVVLLVLGLVGCSGPTKLSTTQQTCRYHVPAEVGSIVVDDKAFAAFVAEVRPDLERESKAKDPEVAKARLFVLSMLDALDGKWPGALAYLDRVRDLEATPEDKAMTGLTLRVWTDVSGDATKYRAAFDARAKQLPKDKLAEQLAMLRTMAQVFTPDVCRQLVNQEVSPHVKDGTVDIEQAHAIVFQRYAVVRLVPVAKDIDDVLGALGVQALKPAEEPAATPNEKPPASE